MMGACGADDDVGVLLRQKFKKQRFQMIDDKVFVELIERLKNLRFSPSQVGLLPRRCWRGRGRRYFVQHRTMPSRIKSVFVLRALKARLRLLIPVSTAMRNGNNTCVAGSASDGTLKRGLMSENSTHTQSHIDSIARQEHEFLEQRTLSERVSDRIAGFAGSMFF